MPAYHRAPVSAELSLVASPDADRSPREQVQAALAAAAASGLGRESGPDSTLLAGTRDEVLDAARQVIEAALDAGVHIVHVKVEATADAARFDDR
jgi:uncharacterized protein YqgV (UPF0045/DUF77 family)